MTYADSWAWLDTDAASDWSDSDRVELWRAINEYAAACGGDPSHATVSGRRMDAVVGVERIIRRIENEPANVGRFWWWVVVAVGAGAAVAVWGGW